MDRLDRRAQEATGWVEAETEWGAVVTERGEVATEAEVVTEWGEVVTEWGEVATEAEVAQGETAEEDMMGEAVRVEATGHYVACTARLLHQQ